MVEIARASAIINATSGSSRFKKDPESVASEMRRQAHQRNIDLHVTVTHTIDDARKAVEQSLIREDDALFVLGGDGTDKDAVKLMHEQKPDAKPEEFGVLIPIPYGSLSLLGRSLGISKNIGRVFRSVDKGEMRHHVIDLGTVCIDGKSEEEFISNAGVGPLIAEPFKRVDRSKDKRGGVLRHLKPVPGIVMSAQHLSGDISISNGQEATLVSGEKASDLVIQNAGPVGPFNLGPRETYNEGEFQVIVARGIFGRKFPKLNTLATATGVLFDSLPFRRGKPSLAEKRFRGKEVIITNLSHSVPVQVDGSHIGDAEESVVFGIKEAALSIAARDGRKSRRCLRGEGEVIVWKQPISSTSR